MLQHPVEMQGFLFIFNQIFLIKVKTDVESHKPTTGTSALKPYIRSH